MVACAYCVKPLICESCRDEYNPASREAYEALSRREVPVTCNGCGALLVCHWCKSPYDGEGQDGEDLPD